MSARLPQFTSRDLIALLRNAGFREKAGSPKHIALAHPDGRHTEIPAHPGDVKRGLMHKILFKDCQLTREEVQRLLR